MNFFAVSLVAAVNVLALALTLPAARNASSWFTYHVAEGRVSGLLGVSLLTSIVSSGSAAFSQRRPPRGPLARADDKPRTALEERSSATPRWLVVLVVAIAIILGRR